MKVELGFTYIALGEYPMMINGTRVEEMLQRWYEEGPRGRRLGLQLWRVCGAGPNETLDPETGLVPDPATNLGWVYLTYATLTSPRVHHEDGRITMGINGIDVLVVP